MFNSPGPRTINSGFEGLDDALGIGGIPRGRIIELSGPEDSLKTMLVLNMLARMQVNGILPAFIDVDNDLTTDYIANSGVDTNLLLLMYLSTDADIIDNVRRIVDEKIIDIIVIDSAGLINPAKERKITAMFRDMLSKLAVIVNGTGTTILFINQLRDSRTESRTKVPLCNQAFDAYASIRLRICEVNRETNELHIRVTRNKLWHRLNEFMLQLA